MDNKEVDFSFWLRQFLLNGKPLSLWSEGIDAGTTNPSEDLPFMGAFLDYVARQTGSLETYESFLKRRNLKLRVPTKDDPSIIVDAKERAHEIPDTISGKKISSVQKVQLAAGLILSRVRKKHLQQKKEQDALKEHPADQAGYAAYILSTLSNEQKNSLLSPQAYRIIEEHRFRHTYVSGNTGSGKSEMLKTLIHHYVTTNTDTALVVIDPHGDFATQVAQFQENAQSDRVIFLSPDFKKGYTPVLNPFEMQQGDDAETKKGEILNALIAVLGEDAQMTKQMIAVLSPCILTLLHLPNTHMEHLKQFMDSDNNHELKKAALKVLTNPNDIEFIKNDFDKSSYAPTRQSIRTRLHIFLTSNVFRDFLIGKTTVDLRQAIDERKLIIFSLTNTEEEDSAALAMGRLILAQLLGIAMQRGKLDKAERKKSVPIHLFIDESHNFAVPSIMKALAEARKYQLYLTLANQFVGQFPNTGTPKFQDGVKKNTYIKITGFQPLTSDAPVMAKLVDSTPEYLAQLSTGKFHVKIGEITGFTVQNGTKLLGDAHSMSATDWKKVETQQLERYYRKISTKEEAMEEYFYTPELPERPKPKRTIN
mgnify:CR=1 FL=1